MVENNKIGYGLSSPWVIFYKQLKELFKNDRDITICFTEEEPYIIDILVDSEDKYNALTQLMPPEREFGNVKVQIRVVPSNEEKNDCDLFAILFRDNPILRGIVPRTLPAGDEINYLMFKPEVAQYYADNLMDPYGNNNELYADIAHAVFGDRDGIRYSTWLKNSEE